ncbi:hypothetical protein DVR12_00810 [Chitinophaga silvatica]|uniref:Uncharacterized protein n=1 Tax=Chitinophaga silvatica TaxID=2282649 RepID=A0A3E1YG38_9BACT|nr:hypothetical protein [Chitinophaga silvatica]RFS26361.1 hypothetical protein DVR12_00810 [Chitinophaga silvatica]
MKAKLHYLNSISGPKASFYSINYQELVDGPTKQLFNDFLEEYQSGYENELMNMIGRLKNMGNTNAAKEEYFRLDEGLDWNDLVCALFDIPEKFLRLYCIRISEQIVILGNGGPKPKYIRAWQDDPRLTKEVNEMMEYSRIIRTKLENMDFRITSDGLHLEGKNLRLI